MEKKLQNSEETKIVNLCEDMNSHDHDDKSFEKMMKVQESNK